MEAVEEVSLEEVVRLAAVDNDFYGRYFFPKAIRQKTPPFHEKIDQLLDNPENRHVAIKVFRGGAKTTKLRVFTSKRIAYGISHTILFVSATQDHACKSISWLKRAIEFNRKWTNAFQLSKGEKWTESEIDIKHGIDEYPIRVIALGITGQTRGVNIDDFRPDLIVIDDPCDEENTATPEGRKKISNLVFGALEKSLAPESESPDAMLAILQTPLDGDDLIEEAMRDKQFASAAFSCFNADGTSAWPARWTTKTFNEEKQAHIDRNQLSLWMREMEVTVIAAELATFKAEWLEYWTVLPEGMVTYISVDPTPPPKENDTTVNPKLDDAVVMAVGFYGDKVYVLDYYDTKSPSPDDLISKIFEYVLRFKPMKVGFESLLFARTTKFYIEKEMKRRGHFFTITPVEDKRKKQLRITQAISRRASNRTLVVNASQTKLIEQYTRYPNVSHDDHLDALAIAIDLAIPGLADDSFIEGEFRRIEQEERLIPDLGEWQSAI